MTMSEFFSAPTSDNFKNILITGGSGFMGSHFVRHLYHKYLDYRIFNLDLLTYAGSNSNIRDIELHKTGIPAGDQRYHFIHGDICDEALLSELFKSYPFAAVVNYAAESHVDRSIIDSLNFIRTNVQGVHTITDLVRKHAIPRFIQISTDEIYGDVLEGSSHEESHIRPSNPYSASKAAADILVQAFTRTHQVPAIIVRGSNNFGPHQYPEKLIPLAVTSYLEGAKIPVHGDGQHVRCWVYVKDFTNAVDLVMQKASLHSIWNISGEAKTNLEVIRKVGELLGKDSADHVTHVNDRPGADMRYAPDSAKIRRELGWQPQYDFDTALAETVRWYVENPDWWRAIKQAETFRAHYEKQSRAQYY